MISENGLVRILRRMWTNEELMRKSICYQEYSYNIYHWCCMCLNGESPCMRKPKVMAYKPEDKK